MVTRPYLRDMSDLDRFALHSSQKHDANGCVLWVAAANNPQGYGRMAVRGVRMTSGRAAYELKVGPVPPGLQVLHRCDNPRCVNPEHLFLGTNADNVADKVSKGRQARLQGAKHPSVKLTEQQVLSIRSDQRRHSLIAADYAIHRSTVSYIKRGQLWAHL